MEIQKLVYNLSQNYDIWQNSLLNDTQIGTRTERISHILSDNYKRLNKLHTQKKYVTIVFNRAKSEISRIFSSLNLPKSLKEMIFELSKESYFCLRPKTKYRNPDKLVPILTYFCFKINNLPINETELLENSKITKKEFNSFKFQLCQFFPKYKKRDRIQYILHKMYEISEYFQLGIQYFYQSKKILSKLWELIKNTKDEVIAGLICSISALCMNYYGKLVSVSAICNRIGIKMSTIQVQVKKHIFNKFKADGFKSLVKSSNILKTIMRKLHLIELKSLESKLKKRTSNKKKPAMIEIKFSYDHHFLKTIQEVSYQFFAFSTITDFPTLIALKTYNPFFNPKICDMKMPGELQNSKISEKKIFDIEILQFQSIFSNINSDP